MEESCSKALLVFVLAALLVGSVFVSAFTMSRIVYAQEAGDPAASNSTSSSSPTNDTSSTTTPPPTNDTSSTTTPPPTNDTTSDNSAPLESTVTLEHSAIEINNPVEWVQTVTLSEEQEIVSVELPADAVDVIVVTSDGQSVDSSAIVEDPAMSDSVPVISLDDVSEVLQENAETKLIAIEEQATGYDIAFETAAPYTIEDEQITDHLYQKDVTVTHDSELHYTDVQSYSDIPEALISQGTEFKLYWMVDGIKTDVTSDARFAVTFVDTDGNGIDDQMRWIVPQLSEQQFVIEGVIVATAAEHLDSNRNFVEDVYYQIKDLDGIWTSEIPAGDYVRVTFEQPLNNTNDITLYARSNDPDSSVEVYEKDGSDLIADFGTISEEGTYKILLTDLVGSQDTFDLKVVGNPVEFDQIIDPGQDLTGVTVTPSPQTVETSAVYTVTVSKSGGGAISNIGVSVINSNLPAGSTTVFSPLGTQNSGTNGAGTAATWTLTVTVPSGNDGTYTFQVQATASGFTTRTSPVTTIIITNDDVQPLLTVTKVVTNDNGGTAVVSDFDLFVNDTQVTSGVQNGFDAGTYTVSETEPLGYAPSITGDCAADGTITLVAGGVYECTITNDDEAASITLTKLVTNDDGGNAEPDDFDISVNGTVVLSGSTTSVASNTAFAIDEAGLTGYSFVDITGDELCPDVLGGEVTLEEGQEISCTITNDDIQPILIVIKHVINHGATTVASDFTMSVSGNNPSPASFPGKESPGTSVSLNAGFYTVTETGSTAYIPSFSSDCTGSITIGETKTCTVTNEQFLTNTGGKTIGFWSNKNGEKKINDGPNGASPELAALRSLNLRNADGSNFNPTTYAQLKTWLLNAKATNMAYMLSAQLAATYLDVEAGFVDGTDVILTPSLIPFAASIPGLDPSTGELKINDLIAAANTALGADGLTKSGDPNRPLQEALKNVLDAVNNNTMIVVI